jgi:hypothetical protein
VVEQKNAGKGRADRMATGSSPLFGGAAAVSCGGEPGSRSTLSLMIKKGTREEGRQEKPRIINWLFELFFPFL